ncbi:MAG: hypothetical protein HGGPFJEG_01651 [Ignavibacteria bacterium]|nr:hypothetical protein [Ignavibacteria bacterium]
MIKLSEVKFDCRHFKGHIPCKPNKEHGVMCNDCGYYEKIKEKILIIKLAAAGDVIRTTPLLYPLRKQYPNSKIYWLTYFPDLIPVKSIPNADQVLKYSVQSVSYLESSAFDILINLDKDIEAISLAEKINAKEKYGFILKDGYCFPVNDSAREKFLTGIFDNVSKVNEKNYMQEIFEICGYRFENEKYVLDIDKDYDRDFPIDKAKKVVGLNTGCGERWTSRLWKDDHWIDLIRNLKDSGVEVILLGGPSEHERNSELNRKTGAKYFGILDIKTFVNLMDKCDVIVSQVTMSMHIAIALNKKLILMNNIFNPHEFYLYGNGEIIQPERECKCFFMPVCINKEYKCMDLLSPVSVFEACSRQLSRINKK